MHPLGRVLRPPPDHSLLQPGLPGTPPAIIFHLKKILIWSFSASSQARVKGKRQEEDGPHTPPLPLHPPGRTCSGQTLWLSRPATLGQGARLSLCHVGEGLFPATTQKNTKGQS